MLGVITPEGYPFTHAQITSRIQNLGRTEPVDEPDPLSGLSPAERYRYKSRLGSRLRYERKLESKNSEQSQENMAGRKR